MAKDDAFKRIQKKVRRSFELKKEHLSVKHPERFQFIGSFQEGVAPALKTFSAEAIEGKGLYGYIDALGETVIPFQYHNAKSFSEGLAAVAIFKKNEPTSKKQSDDLLETILDVFSSSTTSPTPSITGILYGFINLAEDVIIPFQFQDAKSFENGRAEVKHDGKWQWIDPSGKLL